MSIDLLLEEALRKNREKLVDNDLISLVRHYNCNDTSRDLTRKIRDLKEGLNAGKDPSFTQMMLRIILRSNKETVRETAGISS